MIEIVAPGMKSNAGDGATQYKAEAPQYESQGPVERWLGWQGNRHLT